MEDMGWRTVGGCEQMLGHVVWYWPEDGAKGASGARARALDSNQGEEKRKALSTYAARWRSESEPEKFKWIYAQVGDWYVLAFATLPGGGWACVLI